MERWTKFTRSPVSTRRGGQAMSSSTRRVTSGSAPIIRNGCGPIPAAQREARTVDQSSLTARWKRLLRAGRSSFSCAMARPWLEDSFRGDRARRRRDAGVDHGPPRAFRAQLAAAFLCGDVLPGDWALFGTGKSAFGEWRASRVGGPAPICGAVVRGGSPGSRRGRDTSNDRRPECRSRCGSAAGSSRAVRH